MSFPIDAVAQTPEGLVEVREGGRRGFWFGLGIGAGGESYDLQPSAGYSNVLYRPTISLRLGGTVSQHLRLGGEVLSWINENGPAVESLSSALFVAQVYPVTSTGLYLKGGVGIGRNEVDFEDGYGTGDTGFAGLLGAGYELRVGRRIYLNPVIDFVVTSTATGSAAATGRVWSTLGWAYCYRRAGKVSSQGTSYPAYPSLF
jgi:hypothetical protein